MSKAFDYTVITKIKNHDFLMYQKGLDTQSLDVLCSKIDAFLSAGQYNEVCQNLRIANENITRYLYTRLVKRKYLLRIWRQRQASHEKGYIRSKEAQASPHLHCL